MLDVAACAVPSVARTFSLIVIREHNYNSYYVFAIAYRWDLHHRTEDQLRRQAKKLHLSSSGTKDDLIERIHRHNNPPASDSVVARTCQEMAHSRDEEVSEQYMIYLRQVIDTEYDEAARVRDIKKYTTLEEVICEAGEAGEAAAAAAQCVHLARSIENEVDKDVYNKTEDITATSVKTKDGEPFIGVNIRARAMRHSYYKKKERDFNKQLKADRRNVNSQKLSEIDRKEQEELNEQYCKLQLDQKKELIIYKNELKKHPPDLTKQLLRPLKTCAEFDAYAQYYHSLEQSNAPRQETTFVTIRRKSNGQYHTVKRCMNCLICCKTMGKCKTDIAETPVPVGYMSSNESQYAYCHPERNPSQHICYN